MNLRKWLTALSYKAACAGLVLAMGFTAFLPGMAEASTLVFTTEGDGTLIDQDLDGDSNFSLFFGTALTEEIEFDTANDRFNISNDVRVEGDVTATGAVNGADANFTGNADIQGNVSNSTGNLTLNDAVDVTGALDVAGNITDASDDTVTIDDNAVVTGTSDLQGNVSNSTGDITLDDNVDITQGLDVQGGDITLQNDDSIQNTSAGTITINATDTNVTDLNVGDELDVTGATTLNTLDVSGNITDASDDTVTVDDNLDVTGTTSLDGNTTVETGANFTVTDGTSTFGGALDVNSTSDFSGDITLSNDAQIINLRAGNAATAGAPACADASDLGRIFYDTDTEELKYCQDTGAGFAYVSTATSGTANVNSTFIPEFGSLVTTPDGTNNRGTLIADFDDTENHNYYRWTTRQNSLNDYDLVLNWKVPENFSAFQATPIVMSMKTNTATITDNQIDIVGEDTAGSALVLTGASDLATAAATWEDKNIGITGGTFTPGELINLRLKVQADNSNTGQTYIGPIKINYVESN